MEYSHSLPLPLKIAEYINEYFPGKTFINYKKEGNDTGNLHYVVYLHDDDNRYCLKFSERGNYICQSFQPLYSDYQEQYF